MAALTAVEAALRWLPAVHVCRAEPPPAVRALAAGERLEHAALDAALADIRGAVRTDPAAFADAGAVREAVHVQWAAGLARLLQPALGRVINATGVVIHTNLGRAPLAEPVLDAVRLAGARYSPLEYDLDRGERSSRYRHAAALLRLLTGAADALVVNNNAAALLLAADTLAAGRDLIISRGELLEIGGGFRVHEILAGCRAHVVEVGSTNRTHVDDYARALAGDVGAVLKVHRANFSQVGFVASVALDELCAVCAARGVPVLYDQGSGLFDPLPAAPGEPTVRQALASGAALVCASGDKLLGGPQAGLLCGDAEWIARCTANPLLRALRVDKLTLAALEATLRIALTEPDAVPVRAMVSLEPAALRRRADALQAALQEIVRAQVTVAPHAGRTGGGSLPEIELPGWALRVVPHGLSPAAFEARLREGDPPIVARVADDAVWLDVRTLLPGDAECIAARLDALLA
ncbi:MAG: L-seryl-tRNA(Sec) selenium transferase [Gemmatimonadota bacterium]